MNRDTSQKGKLIKRLRYLWTWELFDSFFLPAVMIFAARIQRTPLGFFAVSNATLVTWILWQGAAYWRMKLRAVKNETTIAAQSLQKFRLMKTVNWGLIGLLPLLMIGKGVTGPAFRSDLDVAAGLGFYVLAVLEQINYYHYQLMYDCPADWQYLLAHKRLKRSKLYRDLESLERTNSKSTSR